MQGRAVAGPILQGAHISSCFKRCCACPQAAPLVLQSMNSLPVQLVQEQTAIAVWLNGS